MCRHALKTYRPISRFANMIFSHFILRHEIKLCFNITFFISRCKSFNIKLLKSTTSTPCFVVGIRINSLVTALSGQCTIAPRKAIKNWEQLSEHSIQILFSLFNISRIFGAKNDLPLSTHLETLRVLDKSVYT